REPLLAETLAPRAVLGVRSSDVLVIVVVQNYHDELVDGFDGVRSIVLRDHLLHAIRELGDVRHGSGLNFVESPEHGALYFLPVPRLQRAVSLLHERLHGVCTFLFLCSRTTAATS